MGAFGNPGSAAVSRREQLHSAALVDLFAPYLAESRHEIAAIAGLDEHGCLVGFLEKHGDASQVADIVPLVRSILGRSEVREIIVAHCHPNASAEASAQDRLTTDRLAALSRLAGALLIDHIIFGNDGVYSLSENALLPP